MAPELKAEEQVRVAAELKAEAERAVAKAQEAQAAADAALKLAEEEAAAAALGERRYQVRRGYRCTTVPSHLLCCV